MEAFKGELLDILHTIDLDKLYPIVRCEVKLVKAVDINRLKKAVSLVGQIIPEIFGYYHMENNSFVVEDKDVERIIVTKAKDAQDEKPSIDLLHGPQLQIVVSNGPGKKQKLVFLASHILMDGAGFKELLTLLANCYNYGEQALSGIKNDNSLTKIRDLLASFDPADTATDHPTVPLYLPALVQNEKRKYVVGSLRFSKEETIRIKEKAHHINVTLNDIFMASFGQVIQGYCGIEDFSMACPTDMRRQFKTPSNKKIHVANLTARYNLNIPNTLGLNLREFTLQIHKQMSSLKAKRQFLQSIQELVEKAENKNLSELQEIVQAHYHVRPIAYTNFGNLDAEQIRFEGSKIEDFILTGSFRQAPMFQVAVATFDDRVSLAFNMLGTQDEYHFGKMILEQMKNNILLL